MVKGITMDYDRTKKLSKKKKPIFCGSRVKDNYNNSVPNYSPHLGGYKQKIKTLSENNKNLVEALENYRYRCSEKDKMLIQVSTTVLQNTISAKIKLNKLADVLKEASSIVKEVTSFVNTTSSMLPSILDPTILSKLKKSHYGLNDMMESISEEYGSNWDGFTNKPPTSQGESANLMGKNNTSFSTTTPSKINASERQKVHLKQNRSEGRVSVPKVIRKSNLRSQFSKQKTPSDIQKPGSVKKRCRNITEVNLCNQFSTPKKKKIKFNKDIKSDENVVTVNPLEVSLGKLQNRQNTNNLLTKQLQNCSHDVPKKDEIERNLSNISLDKHPEAVSKTKVTTKQRGKLVQKGCKTNSKTTKSSYEKKSALNVSAQINKPAKIHASDHSSFEENDAKKNYTIRICYDIEDAKCHKEGEFPKKNVEQLSKRKTPTQNKSNEKSIETVCAEIHEPPSGEVASRKACSPNFAVEIMQPCVVLTDIFKFGQESDRIECSKDKPSIKIRNIKSKRKSSCTKKKASKAKEKVCPNIKASRSCRSHSVACYTEPNLKKKLRKS